MVGAAGKSKSKTPSQTWYRVYSELRTLVGTTAWINTGIFYPVHIAHVYCMFAVVTFCGE